MRVLLSGYYGFRNIGDEAILAAIAEQLPVLVPEVEFEVLSGDPGHTRRVHDLEACNRWRVREVARALRRCDLLVQGGGGLIQDTTSWVSPAYYLGLLAMARWCHRPYVVFCQGLGPLRRRLWQRSTARCFSQASAVLLRDGPSAHALQAWGFRGKAEVVADPVVLMSPSAEGEARQWLAGQGFATEEPPAVLVPRDLEGYRDVLEGALRALARRSEAVLVIPFQAGDEGLARALAAEVDGATATSAPEDPRIAAAVLAGAREAVAMRLHALVFAASAGTPALGIAYDPKVVRFCEDVGYEHVDSKRAAAVEEMLNSDEVVRGPVRSLVDAQRSLARRAFEVLAGVLRSVRR